MYQQIKGSTVILRVSDGAYIPSDPTNRDWQAYRAWQLAGNTPAAEPAVSPEQLQAEYIAALDAHIDSTAKLRGYDNRVTCALRIAIPGAYQAEGAAFAIWMDACYHQGTQAMAAVMAGQRPMPTIPEFLAELPPMVWPEVVQ